MSPRRPLTASVGPLLVPGRSKWARTSSARLLRIRPRVMSSVRAADCTADDPLNQHGSGGGPMSLREVLVGTIEEYARHLGHVDLLRERIDGRIGQ